MVAFLLETWGGMTRIIMLKAETLDEALRHLPVSDDKTVLLGTVSDSIFDQVNSGGCVGYVELGEYTHRAEGKPAEKNRR